MKSSGIAWGGYKPNIVITLSSHRIDWFASNGSSTKHIEAQVFGKGEEGSVLIPSEIKHGDKTIYVCVIVDSVVEDLDRVKISDPKPGIVKRYGIFKALKKVRAEYPYAKIFKLSATAYPEIASILHSPLSETFKQKLVELQKHNVVVTHLTSATQLLCHCFADDDVPTVFGVPTGTHSSRHFAVLRGNPLFLRHLSNSPLLSGNSVSNDLRESVSHVAELLTVKESKIRILTPLTELDANYSSSAIGSVYANHYMAFEDSRWHEMYLDEVDVKQISLSSKKRKTKMLSDLSSLKYRKIPNTTLQPSIQHIVDKRQLKYLSVLVYVSCSVIAVLIVIALLLGIHYIHDERAADREREILERSIEEIHTSLNELSAEPQYMAETAQRLNRFAEIKGPTIQDALSSVAIAIQGFEKMGLQRIRWQMSEKKTDAILAHEQATSRTQLWGEDTRPSVLRMEIVGEFREVSSVRSAQLKINDLAQLLGQNILIDDVVIVDSPIKAAQSGRKYEKPGMEFSIQYSLRAS